MRLNKYIAMSGVCSRRKADELISKGKVCINGEIVSSLGIDVKDNDIVQVNGKNIIKEEKKVYIMLNKPKGYITTSSDQFSRPCVMDLIHENVRVFPIGRLDMDTEGMLLLTNDGEFANSIIHPRNKIKKKYVVEVHQKVTKDKLDALCSGVDIGGYITNKASAKMIDKNHLELTISEGKNRQIRKMCEALGIIVYSLKRIAIGNLELGSLKLGEYIMINKDSI